MDKEIHAEASKFLSYILRHKPETIGLTLDAEGWADIDTLLRLSKVKGHQFDKDLIRTIVEKSAKKRFTLSPDGLHIRAAQGHSSQQVDIRYEEKTPPALLYHGTATRFLASIFGEGLKPQSRQYVHLSGDESTAIQVGMRHGKPVVLKIQARTMHEQGFTFFQAENGVWLTEKVPYQFIQQ
ncbi:RNA 2'-phosphotransferase [Pantoea sp. SGAir0183]